MQPIRVEGLTLSVSTSIGIASGLPESADVLVHHADVALYDAKAAGKDGWAVFAPAMHTAALDSLELEMDLAAALDHDEFLLLYQPIVDLRTERTIGVEALISLAASSAGHHFRPNGFIPAAEQNGLITQIGRWVLHAACQQVAQWHEAGWPLQVSVNLSARQLEHDGVVDDVAAALTRSGLDPAALVLEVTETALMHDSDACARRIDALKALGLRVAIDDFGTGYSSLAYLRQLHVDVLKIDRSFISGIATSPKMQALVHALVQLGNALDLRMLGEGIENTEQLRQLQSEHYDYGQGYLFAHPLDAGRLVEFLSTHLSPETNGGIPQPLVTGTA